MSYEIDVVNIRMVKEQSWYSRKPLESCKNLATNGGVILSNAASIIAVHNHPSGNIIPSREDNLITQKLREAGNLLDIELLDHVIIGGQESYFFSYREDGILKNDFAKQFREERYRVKF